MKGTCKAMLTAFLAFKYELERGKIEAKTMADLAALALSTRPTWHVSEKTLDGYTCHNNKGGIIIFGDDISPASVILSVVLVEQEKIILEDSDPREMLSLIIDEYKKVFHTKKNEIENIINDNSNYKLISSKVFSLQKSRDATPTPFRDIAFQICKIANDVARDILKERYDSLDKCDDETSYRVFFELLAYYQFTILIYYAHGFDIQDDHLNCLGGDLNKEFVDSTLGDSLLHSRVSHAVSDNNFHYLVSNYLAFKKDILEMDNESFESLVALTQFKKYAEDYMMLSCVISLSRILKVVGYTNYDLIRSNFMKIWPIWITHSTNVTMIRKVLKEIIETTGATLDI